MSQTARAPRRILPIVALALTLAGLAAPSALAADLTVEQAELEVVRLINADRTAHGLVAMQVDSRLMSLARYRSTDMATKHYFSHTQPDGKNVFKLLTERGITWFNAGEIIAYNHNAYLADSAPKAVQQWLGSAPHRGIIRSTDFNYIGVGVAIDRSTGRRYWTAVTIRGPDRTGAYARAAAPTVSSGATTATRRVGLSWTGADVRLQVLTSGLHSFRVERRVDNGVWATVTSATTSTSLSTTLSTGHTYDFRVRARDRAGNYGAWSAVRVTLEPSRGSVVVRR